jgi:hypothetical protein
MKKIPFILTNENGAVLVLALFLIATLSLIGLAANRNIAIDTAIGANHVASIQSFYVAEAGLEIGAQQAISQLAGKDLKDFTSLLSTKIKKETPVNNGHFTVTILNNSDELNVAIDTDRIITIKSQGVTGGSTSTLAAVAKARLVPKLTGGITFVNDADLNVSGSSFLISGYDFRLSDIKTNPTGTFAPRPAISLCQTETGSNAINSVIESIGQTNLYGNGQVATTTDFNENTVTNFINTIKHYSGDSIDCSKINLTYYNVQDHGGIELEMGCTNGKGIIIVDGNLTFLDHSNWQGLIVVMGGYLSFIGNNEVRGGVVIGGKPDIHIAGSKTGLELDIGNNVTVLYSSEAINSIANKAIIDNGGKWTILSWQRIY